MKLQNRKSFTLLEITISAALIIVISVIFFASLITSFNYLRRVMELRTASLILQEEVSIVRELKFAEIKALGTTFSSSTMSSLKNATGSIKKSLYNGQDEIIKITFRLNWIAFDGKPQAKSIVTLMTDKGINKK